MADKKKKPSNSVSKKEVKSVPKTYKTMQNARPDKWKGGGVRADQSKPETTSPYNSDKFDFDTKATKRIRAHNSNQHRARAAMGRISPGRSKTTLLTKKVGYGGGR